MFFIRLFKLIRIVFGCVSFLLIWLLSDHHSPWSTFTQEACAAAAICLLYPWSSRQNLSRIFNYTCFLFLSIVLIQFICGLIFFGDFIFAFTMIVLMRMSAIYGATAIVENKQNIVFIFFGLILISATINAFIGLAQWQGLSQGLFILESPTGRAYGNFAQPNQFATLLVMGIASLIIFDTQNKINSIIVYTLSALLIFTLCITESRTGALSLVVITVIVMIFANHTIAYRSLRWLAPGTIIFIALHINWHYISNYFNGKTSRVITYTDSSGRTDLWIQMLSAVQIKPWTGWGWLQLGAAQNFVTSSNPIALNIDHAHNLIIDLIVWFGIPAGILITISIFFWSFKMIKSSLGKNSNKIQFLFLLSLIPILIHSLLEYPFSYIYFLLPTAFIIGTIEGFSEEKTKITKIKTIIQNAFHCLCVLLLIIIAIEYSKIEDDFRAIRLERQFTTKAEEKHIYNSPPEILTQYGYLIKSNRDDSIPESEITLKTMKRFPWLMNHQQHYLALLQEGKCQEATEQIVLIRNLFGKFGVIKTKEAITRTRVVNQCD